MVEVEFIVVDAYSPYTAILARPWLYAMRAISSTLHMKVRGLFGFCVSITHNSKMVGSTERKLVWICFQVLSNELWKLKTLFRCFQVMKTEL